MTSYIAVDLGASSGRVMLGLFARDGIDLREVHRFMNRPASTLGTLHWDVLSLWAGTLDGLRIAGTSAPDVRSVGVDSWAVDYGLLDTDGNLLDNPVHYRDGRTTGVAEQVSTVLTPTEHYARTGIQQLPFNTIYQLAAATNSAAMKHAAHALLIPDLFGYWLTGERATEITNASTTALLDPRTHHWADDIAARVGIRIEMFPELHSPGDRLGEIVAPVARECELPNTSVINVGSHDTASAIAGIPVRDEHFAYISCGTWSLVGLELSEPLTSDAARLANFSNEIGVDNTIRFLRNVMGLWLLQECMRCWQRQGLTIELGRLMADAAKVPGRRALIDPDLPQFLPPGDMPRRIRDECRAKDQPEPRTPAEFTRCILDSLAEAYCRTITDAVRLTGREVKVIHIVGGGARNSLLCQLTADSCDRPVVAGPVEAAAYGNVLVQARADRLISGELNELRSLIVEPGVRTFIPHSELAHP